MTAREQPGLTAVYPGVREAQARAVELYPEMKEELGDPTGAYPVVREARAVPTGIFLGAALAAGKEIFRVKESSRAPHRRGQCEAVAAAALRKERYVAAEAPPVAVQALESARLAEAAVRNAKTGNRSNPEFALEY